MFGDDHSHGRSCSVVTALKSGQNVWMGFSWITITLKTTCRSNECVACALWQHSQPWHWHTLDNLTLFSQGDPGVWKSVDLHKGQHCAVPSGKIRPCHSAPLYDKAQMKCGKPANCSKEITMQNEDRTLSESRAILNPPKSPIGMLRKHSFLHRRQGDRFQFPYRITRINETSISIACAIHQSKKWLQEEVNTINTPDCLLGCLWSHTQLPTLRERYCEFCFLYNCDMLACLPCQSDCIMVYSPTQMFNFQISQHGRFMGNWHQKLGSLWCIISSLCLHLSLPPRTVTHSPQIVRKGLWNALNSTPRTVWGGEAI